MPQSIYHFAGFEVVVLVVVARVAPVADVATVVVTVPPFGSTMHILEGSMAGTSSGGAVSHVSGHVMTLSGYWQQRLWQ